jgi:hypothetical protein
MMFLLTQDWHVGSGGGTHCDLTVPARVEGWPGGATIIDGSNPKWRGMTLPTPLPANAQPLDAAALAQLQAWYPYAEQQRWFVNKGF